MSKIRTLPSVVKGSALMRGTGAARVVDVEYLPPERSRVIGFLKSAAERAQEESLARIKGEVNEAAMTIAGNLQILRLELEAGARKHEHLHAYQQETSALSHHVFEQNEQFKHKVNDSTLAMARERMEATRAYAENVAATAGDQRTRDVLTMMAEELRDRALEEMLDNAANIRRNADQSFKRTVKTANFLDDN